MTMVLACVFVYSKRDICIYSYTISLTAPDLSFLLHVEGGRKGEAELNPAIHTHKMLELLFFVH